MKRFIKIFSLTLVLVFVASAMLSLVSCDNVLGEEHSTQPDNINNEKDSTQSGATLTEKNTSDVNSAGTNKEPANSNTGNSSNNESNTTNTPPSTDQNIPEDDLTENIWFKDETGKLSNEARDEILKAYFEITYEEKEKEYYYSSNQIPGTCYGVFEDTYCLILSNPRVAYPSVMVYVEVAGCTFEFGSTNTMDVYHNGEFYSLEKAYENGILDDAEIEELYNFYTETKWGK